MKNIRFILCTTIIRGMATCGPPNLENFASEGRKILGAAFNYKSKNQCKNSPQIPDAPVLFLKPSSSYIQEGEKIVIPRVFTRVVHEVELGVIIDRTCKNVRLNDAMNYVGGYCLALDMTAQCNLKVAREKGHPWSLGKGFDTSTPVSRFIPACAVPDPHNLRLWLRVNSELQQDGNTRDMIFNIPEMISYASKYMTLEPNDLILTGTPEGASPLKAGDVVECGLSNLAEIRFEVCAE